MSDNASVMTTRGNRLLQTARATGLVLWASLLCPLSARAANWQDNAQKLYSHLQRLHWVAAGHGRKVVYDFVDPNSAVAHALIDRLDPLIAPDGLTVRMILVGYLTPSSAGKAAAILQSRDPLAALDRGEAGFLSGQGSAIAPVAASATTTQILRADFRTLTVLEGNPWMRMAPLLVYRDRQGRVHVFQGRLEAARLAAIIRAAGP